MGRFRSIAQRIARAWRRAWDDGRPKAPAGNPTGRRGEHVAAEHLAREGYRVLARNVVFLAGEIDLVCQAPDGRTIVVVEVKSRVRSPRGSRGSSIRAEEAVGRAKARKLRSLARTLAGQNGWTDRPLRIDIVAVTWGDGPIEGVAPEVRHFVNAVRTPR